MVESQRRAHASVWLRSGGQGTDLWGQTVGKHPKGEGWLKELGDPTSRAKGPTTWEWC